ncbi:MAG: ComF family protein [Verrucomicrobiota bacterium]
MSFVFNDWLRSFTDLIYPDSDVPNKLVELKEPFCQQCEEPYATAGLLPHTCWNCRGRSWALDTIRAAYVSQYGVREAIHGFKYEQKSYYLPYLLDWLTEGYSRFYEGQNWDAVVPVPLYATRQRERGFNQSRELAKGLCKRMKLPFIDLLRRTRKTLIQAKLRRSERIRNQRKAYELKSGFDVQGWRVLIIDDVFTTGATTDACAGALLKEGAKSISALTVARG